MGLKLILPLNGCKQRNYKTKMPITVLYLFEDSNKLNKKYNFSQIIKLKNSLRSLVNLTRIVIKDYEKVNFIRLTI